MLTFRRREYEETMYMLSELTPRNRHRLEKGCYSIAFARLSDRDQELLQRAYAHYCEFPNDQTMALSTWLELVAKAAMFLKASES